MLGLYRMSGLKPGFVDSSELQDNGRFKRVS